MFSKNKVTEIFCAVDDFCKDFDVEIKKLKIAQLVSCHTLIDG